MITWNYGGSNAAVEGSWDNWTHRLEFLNANLIVSNMENNCTSKYSLMYFVPWVNFYYLQEDAAEIWQGSLNSYGPAIGLISLQVHC